MHGKRWCLGETAYADSTTSTLVLESIPHPLTVDLAQKLEQSSAIEEVHPEVMSSRMSIGQVIPAFFLKTADSVFAIVENREQDGYRVLRKGDLDEEDEVYSRLQKWCDDNGYV